MANKATAANPSVPVSSYAAATTARSKPQAPPNSTNRDLYSTWELGTWLKLSVNEKGQTKQYVGQFYCYDPSSGMFALQAPHLLSENKTASQQDGLGAASANPRSSGAVSKFDVFIVHKDFVEKVTNLSLSDGAANGGRYTLDRSSLVPIGSVSLGRLYAKEREAIKSEKERINRASRGLSPLGERVFESLSKTLPCQWQGSQIVVMNEVVVSGPFNAASVKLLDSKKDDPRSRTLLERVRLVISRECRLLDS